MCRQGMHPKDYPGRCVACTLATKARYRETNRDRIRTYMRERYVSKVQPVDDVVVRRLTDGIPTPATVHERREAILILHGKGLVSREIARRVGCCPETVRRNIKRLAG